MKNNYKDFLPEYWIITFEGALIALFVATMAVIGIYWELILSVIFQFTSVILLVRYKRLRKETEDAIRVNHEEASKLTKLPPEPLYDKIKKEYYKNNRISRKILLCHWVIMILLIISIGWVVYVPFKNEQEKQLIASTHFNSLYEAINMSNKNFNTLLNRIDSLNHIAVHSDTSKMRSPDKSKKKEQKQHTALDTL